MRYEHFGNLLQELRLKYNMSRETLAENICTAKQIYRIEKGESEPSISLLHQLSFKFNLDLSEYYKMYFTTNTITGFEGVKSINAALEARDMPLLKSMIETYEILEDFKKGENLQHIYYCKALCTALLDTDYTLSLEYCYEGIKIECPGFSIDKITENMYSNVGITLISCISNNYFALDQFDIGLKVLAGLLSVLETYAINSIYPLFNSLQFTQKIYQGLLYNMGFYLYEHGEYKDAIINVEKGITFSLKENNFRYLPGLLFMKFKLLYHDEKYDEALEYYKQALSLYKITNNESVLNELDSTAKNDFPEIFKRMN
ncbi:helix-turn-helix transcriptional regulator [Anaerocolumna sp. AGMB13025]|uniref:helix-turn-helix domain-containing protein n=1 Tax=Anaerocolumna sp. AGMB13025 TaxID=3039116 RepID=UPI00241F98B8|nr:helix-turn-helix transcriptional regulator [Anaerocolumna sp. AGMB13025]WFR57009.1 helix-turn-helix transcriptional regulator [Anaerocolumna sp. AGMB13025]